MRKHAKRTLIGILLLMGFFSGFLAFRHMVPHKDMSAFQGTYLQTARVIKPFHLQGIDNKPFDNQALKGHWTLVFFGFTHCASICPTTLNELNTMHQILQQQKIKEPLQIVMISLDPERDDTNRLMHYVRSFNPNFYGATGNEQAIAAITQDLGVVYAKANPSSKDILHSGALMLFNPQGQLNAFFTPPHQASLLAKDFKLLARS